MLCDAQQLGLVLPVVQKAVLGCTIELSNIKKMMKIQYCFQISRYHKIAIKCLLVYLSYVDGPPQVSFRNLTPSILVGWH